MNVRSLFAAPLVVLLAATSAGAADAPAQTPFIIPSINSMSGSGAFIGKESEETLRRLETVVNRQGGVRGRPIHFDILDDQSKPQVAVQLLNQVMASGSQIVLGPTITNACLALVPFIQNKIVQWCQSPGLDPVKGSYSFAPSVSGPDIFSAMVRYFHKRGWNRIATLTTTDATGQQADQRLGGAVAQPENKGVEIVAQEHFAPNDLTVTAQIARIKAANPQVLISWVIGAPFVTTLRSLSDSGFEIPVVASNSNMIFDQMKAWAPMLPEELYFSGPGFLGGQIPRAQAKAVHDFFSVTKDVGVTPDFPLSIAWDSGAILVSALRALGTNATAQQIHDYIEHLSGYAGIFGIYDFTTGDQRGLTQRDLTIMRWEPKKLEWVAVSRPGGQPF